MSDNIELNISSILNEVSLENSETDEDFLKYFIHLTALNPESGKNNKSDNDVLKNDFKDLVLSCIKTASEDSNAAILTLMMQNYYLKNYDTFDNLIKRNQNKISICTEVLLKDITQANPQTKDEREKLLRRISIYLVLKSGLGNPGNIQVLREGTAALNSVFTKEDLRKFSQLSKNEKESQLQELLGYVSGIRIFNKDCGKGGESIAELATALPDAVEATSLALSHCLIRIMERVNLLTTSIDAYIIVFQINKNIEIEIPEEINVTIEEFNKISKVLTLYRQYEVFVRKLINDMDKVRVDNKELVLKFAVQLYDLHTLVRYRTAVPADQVFPYFVQLWLHWQLMQNDMFIISTINDVMWNLDTWHEKLQIPHEIINSLLNDRPVVSDAERISQTENAKIDKRINKCTVISHNSEESDGIILQYLGFCALCLCVGALIPANPKLGICSWTEKNYVFCSVDHGKYFGLNPERYIKEVLNFVRNNVELINFLQLYDDIYAVRNVMPLVIKSPSAVRTAEKDIQTETHPIPTFIDKEYSWNIWQHKRRAVQLANIVKCQTHSVQTQYSYGRLEFGCQTDNMRDKMCQTMANASTSTPPVKNFLWGLRGQKDHVEHVIDLTPPIGKKCQEKDFNSTLPSLELLDLNNESGTNVQNNTSASHS